ncbi:MAG: hypothetical protein MOB07_11175 [Acidobacteria bacterium]|nr:hypothetical protein [Acidobacteriota bacterium]
MIVLDEQLMDPRIIEDFEKWYKGSVTTILDLRPHTQIKDDAIPTLLRNVKQPTFITINFADFWKAAAASKDYCIICLKLSGGRSLEVPELVRELLKMKEFSRKKARMGKVIYWNSGRVSYYT